jgi:hypothetical protein
VGELFAGVEDGLVLGGLGDDVSALAGVHVGHALDGEVVGFGGAAGPDDLLHITGPLPVAKDGGDLDAGLIDGAGGAEAEGVPARGGVAEGVEVVGPHGVEDARVEGRGGVVV